MEVDDLVSSLVAYQHDERAVVFLDIVIDEGRDSGVKLFAHSGCDLPLGSGDGPGERDQNFHRYCFSRPYHCNHSIKETGRASTARCKSCMLSEGTYRCLLLNYWH